MLKAAWHRASGLPLVLAGAVVALAGVEGILRHADTMGLLGPICGSDGAVAGFLSAATALHCPSCPLAILGVLLSGIGLLDLIEARESRLDVTAA